MALTELKTADFDHFIASHPLVVIEFSAAWCAPCQDFKQVLLTLQPEFPDFQFATVDIDSETELAQEFEVRSVPATLIIKEGTIVSAESGALSATVFRDLLTQARAMIADN